MQGEVVCFAIYDSGQMGNRLTIIGGECQYG